MPIPDATTEPSPALNGQRRETPAEPSPQLAGRRPLIERIGLAFIAVLLATLFAGVGIAAWLGGEPFLAAMGAIGCLMTAWAGGNTLLRG